MNNAIVSFQTPGLIDPRCISTMGVSIKEGENPIGQFGTGLKYAIAILLRTKGEISIWRGLEELKFTARPTEIRGRTVDVIWMNEQELGFTTHLGSHWKMWQAFRELYCNTVDEDGEHAGEEFPPLEAATTVIVRSEEFAGCLADIGLHILLTKPIYEDEHCAFHPGPGRSIFYRGIKVAEFDSQHPHRFLVNVKTSLTLTEDRTLKDYWPVNMAIANTVLKSKDAGFIEKIVASRDCWGEHEMDIHWPGIRPSEEFMAVTRRVAEDTSRPLNSSAMKTYREHAPAPRPIEAEMTDLEHQSLTRAIEFCKSIGYAVDDYPIKVVDSLGPNTMGQVDKDDRVILLARMAFRMGDTHLAGTLVEEWAHLKFDLVDCTRTMQNWILENLMTMGAAFLLEKGKAK